MAGVSAGSRCVHIGDSFHRDVMGAARAGEGWEAVFVCPEAGLAHVPLDDLAGTPYKRLDSLRPLPEILGCP
jgi:FMN phosphatase YigB (HAD superfamily)